MKNYLLLELYDSLLALCWMSCLEFAHYSSFPRTIMSGTPQKKQAALLQDPNITSPQELVGALRRISVLGLINPPPISQISFVETSLDTLESSLDTLSVQAAERCMFSLVSLGPS